MNVAWLIESTEISGVTRAVLALADALIGRGHRASIITTGPPLTWRQSAAEWIYLDHFDQLHLPVEDVVIVTSASTLDAAQRAGARRCAYYCFSPEASEAGSSIPLLAASEVLFKGTAQPTSDMTFIGAIVDEEVYRQITPREHSQPRVLLCGPAYEERRGIDDGYRAVAHARWFHQKLDLVRTSPFAPSREEPLDAVQEFHVALSASEMTRLLHSCDVAIVPNRRETTFSLLPMEALAAGLPTILTSIPPFLSFGAQHDYALFSREDNPIELGDRLIEMLEDEELRARLSARAREVAQQWRGAAVVGRLERFLEERMQ